MQIVEISLLVMAVVGYCNSAGNYGGIGGYGSGRAGGGSRYGSDGGGGEATRGSGGGGTISNFGEDRGGIGFGGSENRGFGSRGSFGGGFTGGFNQNQNTAPEPYKFDYQVTDEEGNVQYRMEEGDASGAVRGTYGYTDTQGVYRVVDYVADANGFRANVRTNEPGTDGKENRADVQMTVEDPPAGIQDRYSGGGGGSYGSGIGVGVPVAQVSRISGGTGGAPGGVPSSWLTHVAPKVQTQKPKSSGGSSGYGSGNNIIKEKVGNKSSKSGY